MPEIDIILPVYNDYRIFRAIKSIRNFDTEKTSRIIILNGGTDKKLSDKIKQAIHPQDILVTEPDKGLFDALNKGLNLCQAPIIGWIGADDVFTGDVTSADVLSDIKSSGLVIYNTIHVKSDKPIRKTYAKLVTNSTIYLGINNPHYSTFIRREHIPENKFSTDLLASDIDFFLRVFRKVSEVKTVDKDCTVMELGGYSTSSTREIIRRNFELIKIYSRYKVFGVISPIIKIGYKIISTMVTGLKR